MLLFLNDIAGSEVIVILIFILMFFGSKSIPGIAKTMGTTIRQIKDASNEIQSEIKKSAGDIKGDMNLENLIRETTNDIKRPLDQYSTDLNDSIKLEPPRNVHVNQQAVYKPLDQSEDVSDSATTEEKVENSAPEIQNPLSSENDKKS